MERLVVVGFGDIARRALPLLEQRFQIVKLSRACGFDLDRPEPPTIALQGARCTVLHCVPPPKEGHGDPRTARLLAAFEKTNVHPSRIVYLSTSGVYGDCDGARIDESRPPAPGTDRARRRLEAELRLRGWCAERSIPLVVLRVPGIYAPDRLPLAHLRAGLPVLRPEEDVYTNHIHAEDLAAIAERALLADLPDGIFNASDDSEIKMGDWLDLVADARRLPRPPRIAKTQLAERVPGSVRDFMLESRRLDNSRMKRELGVALRYRTVYHGLIDERSSRADKPA